MDKEINLECLSINPTTESLRKIIGDDLLARLSTELGGRLIYVAANPGVNSPLAVCLGLDAAKKLGQIYGGAEFEVPLKPGKKAQILKHYLDGMPKVRISAEMKISPRAVRGFLNAEENKKQLSFLENLSPSKSSE